jgi:hypothetical protein
VREAAKQDGKQRFTALLHHVSIDLLRESYYSLKKRNGFWSSCRNGCGSSGWSYTQRKHA